MMIMKKVFIVFILSMTFSVFNNQVYGQVYVQGTIGFHAPLGSFGPAVNINPGMNATATIKTMLGDNIAIGANIGAKKFGSSFLIPITGLFEFQFPISIVKGYGGIDAGFYIWSYRYKYINPNPPFFVNHKTATRLCPGFAPTAGAIYSFNKDLSFIANMKTHIWFYDGARASLALNAGVVYKL